MVDTSVADISAATVAVIVVVITGVVGGITVATMAITAAAAGFGAGCQRRGDRKFGSLTAVVGTEVQRGCRDGGNFAPGRVTF